jgi:hypothetical protein
VASLHPSPNRQRSHDGKEDDEERDLHIVFDPTDDVFHIQYNNLIADLRQVLKD